MAGTSPAMTWEAPTHQTRDETIPGSAMIMKDEYDFSKAECGMFYRADVPLVPPVYLDPDILRILTARAATQGISLNELVNYTLQRHNLRLFEGLKTKR
jgi:hypothetical protein